MAKLNNKTAMIFMLSFLLIFSMAQGRLLGVIGVAKQPPAPECDAVLGVAAGDTCFDIIKSTKLSADDFAAINPNLNCDALFVGQWLCVAGTA